MFEGEVSILFGLKCINLIQSLVLIHDLETNIVLKN